MPSAAMPYDTRALPIVLLGHTDGSAVIVSLFVLIIMILIIFLGSKNDY